MTNPPLPRPLGELAPLPGKVWPGPGLANARGGLPDELRSPVASYLSACPIVLAWMEHTRDVLEDRFGVDGGSAIASDGQFYWRVDASAYVLQYGIAIPGDALNWMRDRNWKPPDLRRDEYLALYRVLMDSLESDA